MAVTALITVYNRLEYLEKALESVAKQRYSKWKLVVSDCSDLLSQSAEILRIFEIFKRTHFRNDCCLMQHHRKMLQSTHLQVALSNVKTDFVALLDDDDYWDSQHLFRAVDWLEQDPRNGIAMSNGFVVDEAGSVMGYSHALNFEIPKTSEPNSWLAQMLRSFYGSTSGYVIRRQALANWSFPEFSLIDVHLATGVLTSGYRAIGFIEPSYYYRVHSDSHYKKGEQVIRDRHQWRVWLFRRHGLAVTKRWPAFPLLVLKSAVYLLNDKIRSSSRKYKYRAPRKSDQGLP